MNLADELQKLHNLREQGALTEEEFILAKKRLLSADNATNANAAGTADTTSPLNKFHRSLNDKWLGGVCGGLAKSTDIPAWAWRILFVFAVLLHGLGLLVYLLMWIFVPARYDTPRVFSNATGHQE